MNKIIIACMMFMLVGTCTVYAQENKEEQKKNGMERTERRERIKSLKIAYMTEQLALTPEESQEFWPVYNKYQAQLNSLRKEYRSAKKPEDMTDAEAEAHINKRLQMEEEKTTIRRNMARDIQPIIGPKRVLVMSQSESRFNKKVLHKAGKRKGKSQGKRKHKRDKKE